MKYRTLLNMLQTMDENDLNSDAVVYLMESDEYIPVKSVSFVGKEQDVLDAGHFVVNA